MRIINKARRAESLHSRMRTCMYTCVHQHGFTKCGASVIRLYGVPTASGAIRPRPTRNSRAKRSASLSETECRPDVNKHDAPKMP